LYTTGKTFKVHENNQQKSLRTFTKFKNYEISIIAYSKSFDVWIDYDFDGDLEKIGNYDFSSGNRRKRIVMGDCGSSTGTDYGMGAWKYLRIRGHVAKDVKFYENFNDGNIKNWFAKSETSGNSVKPDGIYLYNRGDTYVDDLYLEMNNQGSNSKTLVRTPPLDIVRSIEYTIEMDFNVRSSTSIRWLILMSDCNQVLLYLSSSGTKVKLYNYWGDPTNPYIGTASKEICEITPNSWYFLKVVRSGNQFSLYLNQKYIGKYNIFKGDLAEKAIRIGDFSNSDYFDRLKIDNVMFIQQRDLGNLDADKDELSDRFQALPQTPILYDDFEYGLPFEEYGWQHAIESGKENHKTWEVGYPDKSSDDPDHGITFGNENRGQSLAKRSRVLATNIGGKYPELDMWMKSPIIEVPYRRVQLPDGTFDDTSKYRFKVKVTLWTWYDFEDDKGSEEDGGAVYLEFAKFRHVTNSQSSDMSIPRG
jgi:hypothetical protein